MNIKMRTVAIVIASAGLLTGGGLAASSIGTAQASPAVTSTTHSTSGFTWHPLRLLNGWKAASARFYGTPSYAVKDGVLYLSGILDASRSSGSQVAILPHGARPAHFLWLLCDNFGGSGAGLAVNMEIEPGGDIFVYSNGGQLADPSLQGISFPLSS